MKELKELKEKAKGEERVVRCTVRPYHKWLLTWFVIDLERVLTK